MKFVSRIWKGFEEKKSTCRAKVEIYERLKFEGRDMWSGFTTGWADGREKGRRCICTEYQNSLTDG